MTRLVVLGATFMRGREVERQLRAAEVEVVRAGRSKDMDVVVDLGSGTPPTFVTQGGADTLIHCAAAFSGDDSAGTRNNFRINALGALDTLEISRRMGGGRIVYAGTLFSESALEPDRPMTSYGMSKLEGERILNWGMTHDGGAFCSLRLTQLLDTEGMCCRHQPWFGRIVAYASRGLTLRMPVSEGPRNFLHVSDAARLLIAATGSGLSGSHPVTHPTDTDLHALALDAYAVFGQGGKLLVDLQKKPFRRILFPHDSHALNALGLQPKVDALYALRLIRHADTASRFGPLDVQ